MSCDDVLIEVKNVSKRYEIYNQPSDRLKQIILSPIRKFLNFISVRFNLPFLKNRLFYCREFWALKDVSFSIKKGETFGVIGRNGSGKSTLLQIIAGTTSPTSGDVLVKGRIAALLELGSGFNPEFTGKENVFLNARILGLTEAEINQKYKQIIDFADIGDFIDQPVKTYSSGMFVRLAFAVQANIDASVVIIDEALAVGDVFFRQKCYKRLEELKKSGAAIILVSHAMTDIEQHCENSLLLEFGYPKFIGSSCEATKHYFQNNQINKTPKIISEALISSISNTSVKSDVNRPIAEAYIKLDAIKKIENDSVECIGLALLDINGDASNVFTQGETACFFIEFNIKKPIEMPIFGVVIRNDRGVIVHGKNSLQYENDLPVAGEVGSKIVCIQEIKLNLAPGEYTFDVGFAELPASLWIRREFIAHDELLLNSIRICSMPNCGSFSIGYAFKNGVSFLTHHGLVDLPGKITTLIER
jgi:lipopolysaccharide transport system ATP-binding protein